MGVMEDNNSRSARATLALLVAIIGHNFGDR